VRKIEFLGHVITEEGISITPERIDAIQRFPTPTNVTELQQFLGTINYVGKFIPNKSMILDPLNSLLKDNVASYGVKHNKMLSKKLLSV